MEAANKKPAGKTAFSDYDYSNFYYGAGDDPLNLLRPFKEWYDEALPNGYYLYSEPLSSAPSTKVQVTNRKTGQIQELLNLASYNYLGISYRDEVKRAAIEAHQTQIGELRMIPEDAHWLFFDTEWFVRAWPPAEVGDRVADDPLRGLDLRSTGLGE